jgi:uncharacterized repeat protein (TIGR01451 family)
MPRNWRSRTLGIVGIGALIVGAGVVVAAPAGAAPVADVAALRAMVSSLNTSGLAADIELSPGVTYTLPGSVGCKEDDNTNASGDLDIRRNQPLKIFTPDGQAPAILEMTCPDQRVIEVRGVDGGTPGLLTLRNVVIRNGHAPAKADGANLGGGVLSFGDVAVENSVFENNTAGDGVPGTAGTPEDPGEPGGDGGSGGAVAAQGAVTISGSTFTGNRAGAGGAGTGNSNDNCDGGFGGQGGAVLAVGGLTITNSTFAGNTAGAGGNGGEGRCAAAAKAGAGGDGGWGGAVMCGLASRGAGQSRPEVCRQPMVVRGSTFSGNATGNGGNGGKGRTGGKGGGGGFGGAILFVGGKGPNGITSLLVENSTVDGNASGNGGTGGDGGGDSGNGGDGGIAGAIVAAYNDTQIQDQVAKLVHVTVTENGGGGKGGAAGAPDVVVDQEPSVAAAAGTKGNPGQDFGGSVLLTPKWESVSTVIGVSSPPPGIPDCWRQATAQESSRTTVADNDTRGCGFGDQNVVPFADYALGALADNGGPTKTRLPAANSALVDKVPTAALPVDQRGVTRPQAGGADIGAVELQLIDMAVTKSASETSVVAGTEVTFTITVKNTGTSSPQPGVVVEDPNCTGLSPAAGDTNANNTLDAGELFAYTCTATPTEVGTFTNTAAATITDGAGVKITRTASVDVTVTAAAGGNSPDLASTGVNDPTPELIIGAWLIAGGLVLLRLARPRRLKIRANLE